MVSSWRHNRWDIDFENPGREYNLRRTATSSSVTALGSAMSHSSRARMRSSLGSSAAAWLNVRMRSITAGLTMVPPGVLRIMRRTRCGCFAARRAATQPPSDSPDRCTDATPSASITSMVWST
jgi:hypothetical protein